MASENLINELWEIVQSNNDSEISYDDFENDLNNAIKLPKDEFDRAIMAMISQAEINPNVIGFSKNGVFQVSHGFVTSVVATIKYENQFIPGKKEFNSRNDKITKVKDIDGVILIPSLLEEMIKNYGDLDQKDKNWLLNQYAGLSREKQREIEDAQIQEIEGLKEKMENPKDKKFFEALGNDAKRSQAEKDEEARRMADAQKNGKKFEYSSERKAQIMADPFFIKKWNENHPEDQIMSVDDIDERHVEAYDQNKVIRTNGVNQTAVIWLQFNNILKTGNQEAMKEFLSNPMIASFHDRLKEIATKQMDGFNIYKEEYSGGSEKKSPFEYHMDIQLLEEMYSNNQLTLENFFDPEQRFYYDLIFAKDERVTSIMTEEITESVEQEQESIAMSFISSSDSLFEDSWDTEYIPDSAVDKYTQENGVDLFVDARDEEKHIENSFGDEKKLLEKYRAMVGSESESESNDGSSGSSNTGVNNMFLDPSKKVIVSSIIDTVRMSEINEQILSLTLVRDKTEKEDREETAEQEEFGE